MLLFWSTRKKFLNVKVEIISPFILKTLTNIERDAHEDLHVLFFQNRVYSSFDFSDRYFI